MPDVFVAAGEIGVGNELDLRLCGLPAEAPDEIGEIDDAQALAARQVENLAIRVRTSEREPRAGDEILDRRKGARLQAVAVYLDRLAVRGCRDEHRLRSAPP